MRSGRCRACLGVLGGAVVCLGACLPWMSYFAGLVPLRGVIGLNGRVLFAAGLAAVGLSAARAASWRVGRALPRIVRILGVAVASGALWLIVGVRELTHVGAANAMLAPQPGVGLPVVVLGGLLLTIASIVPMRGE